MSQNTITRGIVTLVDDNKTCQTLQTELLADEVIDHVEHVQPFGVSFCPPVETECIVAAIGDARENCVAFGVTDRDNRPKGLTEPGTGGLYYQGVYKVFIDANGVVHLGAKEADDYVALAQKVLGELNDIRQRFDDHTHTVATSAGDVISMKPSPIGPANSVASTKVRGI